MPCAVCQDGPACSGTKQASAVKFTGPLLAEVHGSLGSPPAKLPNCPEAATLLGTRQTGKKPNARKSPGLAHLHLPRAKGICAKTLVHLSILHKQPPSIQQLLSKKSAIQPDLAKTTCDKAATANPKPKCWRQSAFLHGFHGRRVHFGISSISNAPTGRSRSFVCAKKITNVLSPQAYHCAPSHVACTAHKATCAS